MEAAIIGAVLLILGIGFVGGLIGGRLRGKPAEPNNAQLERLNLRIRDLQAGQELLRNRLAILEAASAGGSDPSPISAAVATTAGILPELDLPLDALEEAALAAPPLEVAEPAPSPAARPQRRPVAIEPTAIDEAISRARTWLLGGNTVVRLGLLVLFFGFAFLARLTVEAGLVPIELRLAGIAAGALALLVFGWRLRKRRPGYALSLQGGGVAVLYLTVFAAMRLYALLSPGFALVLLISVVLLSAALALLQDSPALAVIGTAGGFIAPILASTGEGSHVQLFSYYALLNAGVVLIAWRRAWRLLNLVGFLFTFAVGLAWGARFYQSAFFASTEPFLILFFLMYLVAAVLYAWRHAPTLTHYVDGTLVFGVPVIGFGLQAALVHDIPYGLAWSALALGGLYILLARWLARREAPGLSLLVESFLALGIAFLTLAVPLALDARWTAAAWALEGAALLWIGLRQSRRLASSAGVVLQFAAGMAFLRGTSMLYGAETTELAGTITSSWPVLNAACLGRLLIALAGLFSARLAFSSNVGWKPLKPAAWLLLTWGSSWWFAAGLLEIDRWVGQDNFPAVVLLFFAASAVVASGIARRIAWKLLHLPALAVTPAMLFAVLVGLVMNHAPTSHWGWLAWPLALIAHLRVLRVANDVLPRSLLGTWHVAGVWLLAVVASVELSLRTEQWLPAAQSEGWRVAAGALASTLVLSWLRREAPHDRWPVAAWPRTYLRIAPAGLALALLVWCLFIASASRGSTAPLPYLPLLNPVDLMSAGALLTIVRWHRSAETKEQRSLIIIVSAVGFICANAALLRGMHHYTGVPWRLDALLDSAAVQTALALFWSAISLVLMVGASRRNHRNAWIVGAGLMGIVVAKLFLVDMANSGTVTRIVSFMGAGLLMLAVGYLAPLPPKQTEQAA